MSDKSKIEHRCGWPNHWNEISDLQYNFLLGNGLKPSSKLLDVGCGGMRLGYRVIPYLDPGNYYGIDKSQKCLDDGTKHEVDPEVLKNKVPNILCNSNFDFEIFNAEFDFAIAQSVFTHLPQDKISQCFANIRNVLKPNSSFFATYFDAADHNIETIDRTIVTTYLNKDPYHQHISFYHNLAKQFEFTLNEIGDWGHPINQSILEFKT